METAGTFKEALEFMDKNELDQFKELIENYPTLLEETNKKNITIFQIACIKDKSEFVKFILGKSNDFIKILDKEIPF